MSATRNPVKTEAFVLTQSTAIPANVQEDSWEQIAKQVSFFM
jgi:hypothetical protein